MSLTSVGIVKPSAESHSLVLVDRLGGPPTHVERVVLLFATDNKGTPGVWASMPLSPAAAFELAGLLERAAMEAGYSPMAARNGSEDGTTNEHETCKHS